ncbi:uncharacterized protein EI97DRAFT_438610 [Westerdykella ornata]|uniref:Uncharacterized protein n=1 Tax=Westerdykella ornata TaxID=318751 RepID=A0A6A6JYF0_WESOR|nr:uncharacterized protein EI97DRAFT_438610 [Westerdykella ornata]KAF2281225.1 hypothetical protein EI97DRAFT_438610 [Westerdykella ornata]
MSPTLQRRYLDQLPVMPDTLPSVAAEQGKQQQQAIHYDLALRSSGLPPPPTSTSPSSPPSSSNTRPPSLQRAAAIRIPSPARTNTRIPTPTSTPTRTPDTHLAPPPSQPSTLSSSFSSSQPSSPTRSPGLSTRRSNTPSPRRRPRPRLGKKTVTTLPPRAGIDTGTAHVDGYTDSGCGFQDLKPQLPRRAISARVGVARRGSWIPGNGLGRRGRRSRSVGGTWTGRRDGWEGGSGLLLTSTVFPGPSTRLGASLKETRRRKRQGGSSGTGNERKSAGNGEKGRSTWNEEGTGVWTTPREASERMVKRWETVVRFVVEGLDSDSDSGGEPEFRTVGHDGVVVGAGDGDAGESASSTATTVIHSLPSRATASSFSDKIRVRETLKQRRVQRLDTLRATTKTTVKARGVDFQLRDLPDTPGSVVSTPRELYGGLEPGPRRLWQPTSEMTMTPTTVRQKGNGKGKSKQRKRTAAPPRVPRRPNVRLPPLPWGVRMWDMGTINEDSVPPPLDQRRRIYIPAPVRLCDVGALPPAIDRVYRKGWVATLEPFGDAMEDVGKVSESRRASDDAVLDDIADYFSGFAGAAMPDVSGPDILDRFWRLESEWAEGEVADEAEGGDMGSRKRSDGETVVGAVEGRLVPGHLRAESEPPLTPGRARERGRGRGRIRELLRFSR